MIDQSPLYTYKITSAHIANDELILKFEDGKSIGIYDAGQICCEKRYMSTDDNLESLIGARLLKVEVKTGPMVEEDHEQCFLEIQTDKGFITLVNHNEHNGYYGGFELKVRSRNGF